MTEKWDEIKGKLRYALIGFLSCFIFKDFSGKKKVQRVLVLNLTEISKEFLIFIDLKITETKFTTIQSPFVTFE